MIMAEYESGNRREIQLIGAIEDDERSRSPICKRKGKRPSEDYDDDEGKVCPICFDIWTSSGDHRVCALKCGHLFGYSCLERWLKDRNTCPTCKSTVKMTDITYIYAKKLLALDTSELTAVKKELEFERHEKSKIQLELIQSKQGQELIQKDIVDLKKKIEILKTCTTNLNLKISKEKYYEVSKYGGCRVMDFNESSSILVISSHYPYSLCSSFGVFKLQGKDFETSSYIPLHSAVIRDLSFHPHKKLLLSVSDDKSIRLTDINNSRIAHTVQCSASILSCCWDITNPNYFFTGEQNGSTVKFDIRKANKKFCTLEGSGDSSPVISLASAGWSPGTALPRGGLFICQPNSCTVLTEKNNKEYSMHPLDFKGPLMSMCYNNFTGHLLVTSRASSQKPCSRHTLCTMIKNRENAFVPNIVQVFEGSPVQIQLTRSCQMNIAGNVLVSAYQETNKVVDVWQASNGKKITALPAHSPVFDMCPLLTDSAQYLCTLNEKKLGFFKIESS